MACRFNGLATDIFQREREEREVALQRLADSVPPDDIADEAHDSFFRFRRGVLHKPDMTSAVLFNNNPCSFRDAEWVELRRLVVAHGYEVIAEGQSSSKDDGTVGYTRVMLVRLSGGAIVSNDVADLAGLMADALRNIGHAEQLFHEIRIEG